MNPQGIGNIHKSGFPVSYRKVGPDAGAAILSLTVLFLVTLLGADSQ